MAELYQLQEQEIPEAMTQLIESHTNLKKVADYCEGLYLQAAEKKPALEETRGYTTQALASVAYQINTLATSFLSLLDLQARQLVDMESSINHLSQTVTIHKEKVARREIGVLTTNKSFPRPVGVKSPGIIFPDMPEKPVKYVRKPIDYTILDTVGCGGPKTQISGYKPKTRGESVSSTSSSSKGGSNVPRHSGGSVTSTLSRVQSSQRPTSGIPGPPVAPPQVPSHYMSAMQLQNAQHANAQSNLSNPIYGYSPGPPGPPPPPPGPAANGRLSNTQYHSAGLAMYNGNMVDPPSPISPPLPPMPGPQDRYGAEDMPPPPPDDFPDPVLDPAPPSFPNYPPNNLDGDSDGGNRDSIPFPPPAPELDGSMAMNIDPPWAPESYMEKVVALFDYEPQNDDELRFRENAVLYVTKKNSDGWWEGVMESDEGQRLYGLFPENYVESLL